ncbi:MAG: hypothetical protein NXI24_04975 [bacterium]|nr:hypothetical protein [bacterium]
MSEVPGQNNAEREARAIGEAARESDSGQRAGFRGRLIVATLLALGLTAVLASWLASAFGAQLDPVQFRVYLWENALYFLYFPAAFLIFVLARLLTGYGYLRRGPACLAGWGVAAGLLCASLWGFQIVRPEAIVWTELSVGGGSAAGESLWLPQRVAKARALGLREQRPVLYYLHADWCHSCEDFESYVLGSPYLQRDLEPFIKVRLDVTDIHRWQDYLDRKLGVSAVPSLIVRDRAGRLIPRPVIGENVSLRAVRSVLEAASVELPTKAAVR